jgi:hypothetical protein
MKEAWIAIEGGSRQGGLLFFLVFFFSFLSSFLPRNYFLYFSFSLAMIG